MKRGVILLLLLLFFLCMNGGVWAAWEEAFGTDALSEALPPSAAEILGDTGWKEINLEGGLKKLTHYAEQRIGTILRETLRPAVGMLAVVTLCTAAEGLIPPKSGMDYINLGGSIAIAALSVRDVNSMLAVARRTMSELADFSRVLLPTLATCAAGAGAMTSAPAKYAAAMLFLDILSNAAEKLIFPLLSAGLAGVIANATLRDRRLNGMVKLLKWSGRFFLTALATTFTAYLGLTGITAGNADAAITKAAKAGLSTALPVVGGIISDAAGSIVAGAGVIRGAVGCFGLLAVLAACIVPFLELGLRYLLFKAAAALCGAISGERLGKMIDGIGSVCGMILGLVGTEVILIYISLISLVKAVSG